MSTSPRDVCILFGLSNTDAIAPNPPTISPTLTSRPSYAKIPSRLSTTPGEIQDETPKLRPKQSFPDPSTRPTPTPLGATLFPYGRDGKITRDIPAKGDIIKVPTSYEMTGPEKLAISYGSYDGRDHRKYHQVIVSSGYRDKGDYIEFEAYVVRSFTKQGNEAHLSMTLLGNADYFIPLPSVNDLPPSNFNPPLGILNYISNKTNWVNISGVLVMKIHVGEYVSSSLSYQTL